MDKIILLDSGFSFMIKVAFVSFCWKIHFRILTQPPCISEERRNPYSLVGLHQAFQTEQLIVVERAVGSVARGLAIAIDGLHALELLQ